MCLSLKSMRGVGGDGGGGVGGEGGGGHWYGDSPHLSGQIVCG